MPLHVLILLVLTSAWLLIKLSVRRTIIYLIVEIIVRLTGYILMFCFAYFTTDWLAGEYLDHWSTEDKKPETEAVSPVEVDSTSIPIIPELENIQPVDSTPTKKSIPEEDTRRPAHQPTLS